MADSEQPDTAAADRPTKSDPADSHLRTQRRKEMRKRKRAAQAEEKFHNPPPKKPEGAPGSSFVAVPVIGPNGEQMFEFKGRRHKHPFSVNFNDHFETGAESLKDVLPVVEEYRSYIRPSCPEMFTIYDPYYCAGEVKNTWKALGVEQVINDNRDFYADIESGVIPKHDMLITNPPYSSDHIQQLFRFLVEKQGARSWAVLVPDYIATKPWYIEMIKTNFAPAQDVILDNATHQATRINNEHARDINKKLPAAKTSGPIARRPALPISAIPKMPMFPSSTPPIPTMLATSNPASTATKTTTTVNVVSGEKNSTEDESLQSVPAPAAPVATITSGVVGVEPFYVIPDKWYDFKHPEGVGNQHSHFKTMWFVWCGRRTKDIVRAMKSATVTGSDGERKTVTGCSIAHGLEELNLENHVRTTTRKNPQQRERQQQSRPGRF